MKLDHFFQLFFIFQVQNHISCKIHFPWTENWIWIHSEKLLNSKKNIANNVITSKHTFFWEKTTVFLIRKDVHHNCLFSVLRKNSSRWYPKKSNITMGKVQKLQKIVSTSNKVISTDFVCTWNCVMLKEEITLVHYALRPSDERWRPKRRKQDGKGIEQYK